MKNLIVAVALAFVLAQAAQPQKKPLKPCGNCGRGNEPDNTRCWYCQAEL